MNRSEEPRGSEAGTKSPRRANLLLSGLQTRGKRQPIIAVNSRRGRAVSKPEWGVKRLCQSCGTKFYDLQRAPITCPSCGTEADRESPLKSRRSRSAAGAPKPVHHEPVEPVKKPQPVEPVKKPQPVEADADGDADAGADGKEAEDTDLGDADQGEGLADDSADDSDDDVIEDTSELGDGDVSDVVDRKAADDEP